MSGDVQPRKRKDKRKKKDDLNESHDEARGTAALFGEGDIVMHSHHDHGTGGNICAKIVFFTLLAILIGLLTLIVLENKGLDEIDENELNEIKESRFAGVLEGWLETESIYDSHSLEPENNGEVSEGDENVELEDIEHLDIDESDHDSEHEDEHDDENDDEDEHDDHENPDDEYDLSDNDVDNIDDEDQIENPSDDDDGDTDNNFLQESQYHNNEDDDDDAGEKGDRQFWTEHANENEEKPYDEIDEDDSFEVMEGSRAEEEEDEYEKRQNELNELSQSNEDNDEWEQTSKRASAENDQEDADSVLKEDDED